MDVECCGRRALTYSKISVAGPCGHARVLARLPCLQTGSGSAKIGMAGEDPSTARKRPNFTHNLDDQINIIKSLDAKHYFVMRFHA